MSERELKKKMVPSISGDQRSRRQVLDGGSILVNLVLISPDFASCTRADGKPHGGSGGGGACAEELALGLG